MASSVNTMTRLFHSRSVSLLVSVVLLAFWIPTSTGKADLGVDVFMPELDTWYYDPDLVSLLPYSSARPAATTYIVEGPNTTDDREIECNLYFCDKTTGTTGLPTVQFSLKFGSTFGSISDGISIKGTEDPTPSDLSLDSCRLMVSGTKLPGDTFYLMAAITSADGSFTESPNFACLSFPKGYFIADWRNEQRTSYGRNIDDSGQVLNPFDPTMVSATTRIYSMSPVPTSNPDFVTCTLDACTVSGNPTIQLTIKNNGVVERPESLNDYNAKATGNVCPIQVTTRTSGGDHPWVILAVTSPSGSITLGKYLHCQLGPFPTEELNNDRAVGSSPIVDKNVGLTKAYDVAQSPQTTRIYKFKAVERSKPITCILRDCVSSGGIIQLSMKFYSTFTSIDDYAAAATGQCVNSSLMVEATPTRARADVYVMATIISLSGDLSEATFECYESPTPTPSGVPTPVPTPPPTKVKGPPNASGGATTPAPVALPTNAPCGCFSETSWVEVQDRGIIMMKDLQVNDFVYTGNDANHKPIYQKVFGFGHLDENALIEYVRIHTSKSSSVKPMEISVAHLLYVEGTNHPFRADSIQVGDVLIQQTAGHPSTGVVVQKLERVFREGAYMPLTKDGTIVVNGVLASSYVSILEDAPKVVTKYLKVVSEDQLLHWWLSPYRVVCSHAPSLCKDDYNEEGIAHWLVFGRSLARIADGWGEWIQTVGIVFVGMFMAMCMGLELFLECYPIVVPGISFLLLAKNLWSPKRELVVLHKKVE